MMRVFLCGEGPTELGGRSGLPQFWADNPDPGVLEAILLRIREDGWVVHDAIAWKHLRKYRSRNAGDPRHLDHHNALAAALKAKDAGCHAIVFVRDADNDEGRPKAIGAAIDAIKADHPSLRVAGGVAVRVIEAWILALTGVRSTEKMAGKTAKDRVSMSPGEMIAVIESSDLHALPPDAESLAAFLEACRTVLS